MAAVACSAAAGHAHAAAQAEGEGVPQEQHVQLLDLADTPEIFRRAIMADITTFWQLSIVSKRCRQLAVEVRCLWNAWINIVSWLSAHVDCMTSIECTQGPACNGHAHVACSKKHKSCLWHHACRELAAFRRWTRHQFLDPCTPVTGGAAHRLCPLWCATCPHFSPWT